jgi:hypothetical protein
VKQVPLSGKVVFVDWHSVLSRDPFWMSIRESATHPLKAQLEANLAEVFTSKANEWMKGLLSSDDVIRSMDIELDGRFRDDFLTRRLYVDCAKMRVNAELFETLRKIKAQVMVVLALVPSVEGAGSGAAGPPSWAWMACVVRVLADAQDSSTCRWPVCGLEPV